MRVNTINSANISLFKDTGFTPTEFHAGDFIASQWTTNLDLDREFEIGLASPLNVAFGLEHRHETYEIKAGDRGVALQGRRAVVSGLRAHRCEGRRAATTKRSTSTSRVSPIDKLQVDIAGRFEHFSDFGDTSVGKLTSRYDFTRGVRDSRHVQHGLSRADAGGSVLLGDQRLAVVRQRAAAAEFGRREAASGIEPLQPEDSTNYSLGFVLRPIDRLTVTLDAYQIKIEDRIVGSGTLCGTGCTVNSPAVVAAIAANGNVLDPTVTSTGIAIFANGLDTRTRGADLDADLSQSDYKLGPRRLVARRELQQDGSDERQADAVAAGSAVVLQRRRRFRTWRPPRRSTARCWAGCGRWIASRVSLKETVYGPASRHREPERRPVLRDAHRRHADHRSRGGVSGVGAQVQRGREQPVQSLSRQDQQHS